MFGPSTWEIKLWKIFISAPEFVILIECKAQFISLVPVDCHLMV
jgi:hypothetical protein